MDINNLNRIRDSFPAMYQHKAEISRRFYEQLFQNAPETRAMFGQNIGAQREMLATVLTTLAKSSFQPDSVQEILSRLGRSHAKLGLTKTQFDVGEAALRDAIVTTMQDRLSAETLEAWQVAVWRVIDAMRHPPPD